MSPLSWLGPLEIKLYLTDLGKSGKTSVSEVEVNTENTDLDLGSLMNWAPPKGNCKVPQSSERE